ncbi:MAG: DNA-directed RNA polymerase subunit omega [Synergistota bacterium]|nr:DNA-directed RNA polymerase subunit omega [Synergistaceae bacterium]MDY9920805.1 DNA-directed RNA polymerase subunit omega [Synergistota bacterium]
MIFMDLEKIYKNRDIPNKYILTLVVSARARQLSERKGAISGYDEKFITRAVEDLTQGRINYSFVDTSPKKNPNEPVEA